MFVLFGNSLGLLPSANAVTRNWIGGSANWNSNGNWNPFGVPAANDAADIVFGDGVGRVVTYDYTGPAVTLNSLTLDLTGSIAQSTTLSMAANNLHVANEWVGNFGRGTVNQTGGTHTVDTAIRIGELTNGGTGTYNISNTATLSATSLFLHRGTLNISGDAFVGTNEFRVLANVPGSAVNINGGTLFMGEYVSTNGLDVLNFNSGEVSLGGDFTFGSSNQTLSHLGVTSGIGPNRTIDMFTASFENGSFGTIIDGGTLNAFSLHFDDEMTPANLDDHLLIRNGGRVDVTNSAFLGREFTSSPPSKDEITVTGVGSLFQAESLRIGDRDPFSAAPFTDENTFSILDGAQAAIGDLQMGHGGKLVLGGGTLLLGTYLDVNGGGEVDFQSGTVEYNFSIDGADPRVSKFFGSVPTITAGKGMTVFGAVDFRSTVVVDGGTLTVDGFADGSRLDLRRGTLFLSPIRHSRSARAVHFQPSISPSI